MTSETTSETVPPVLHAVIDAPTADVPVDRFGFLVRGWLWFGKHQDRIQLVEAWTGEVCLGRTTVLVPRRDVSQALAIHADAKVSYEIPAKHADLPRGAAFTMALRVGLVDGTWLRPDVSVQVRTWGQESAENAISPILVAASLTAPTGPEEQQMLVVPPPDHLQVRQVGRVAGHDFYRKGRAILAQLDLAFRRAGVVLGEVSRVLDFGCGCGRVMQSFRAFPRHGEIWGCDIDADSLDWDRVHLADIAHFVLHGFLPPTPMESGSFDAIYAVSVFTHLPEELQYAWLTELRRLLRPGGVLVATVHGGPYWSGDEVLHAEVARHGFAYRTGPRTEGLPDFYMVAYHSESYIRSRWGRLFEVVDVAERLVHNAHDAVILRRAGNE